MSTIKVVTINIFSDLSLWNRRKALLLRELALLKPDLIALQEVSLQEKNAHWLANELGFPEVFVSPKTGKAGRKEGIAILSRLPFERAETLDLRTQHRVAQYVLPQLEGEQLAFVNGHFFWQPGDSPERLAQIELLLNWLERIPGDPPVVVCGDFNATPESQSVRKMLTRFGSAYAVRHGREPEYTTPTPLPRSKRKLLVTLITYLRYIRISEIRLNWRGTLDYIFVGPRIVVQDSSLVLNRPDPVDPKIYPSDHFGLSATLELND
jgi:endonuclease/exonuclease/phosphatase family metal-dependent hydrolase